MKSKPICAAAILFAALSVPVLSTPARAAEQLASSAVAFPDERLRFPESPTFDIPVIASLPTVPQQAAVALPSPQFTGLGAVAILATLLRCRKSILRFIC